jgi:hypothetical protein
MQNTKTQTETIQLDSKVKAWFEEFIAEINVDFLALETNVATTSKKEFYSKLANSNTNEIALMSRVQSSTHFIKELIFDYTQTLKLSMLSLRSLAMDLSDAKVLVWTEIEDDDESTENALRLLEAKVNANFYQYGFHISSTIVEKSDCLPIPSHYQTLIKSIS